MLNEMIRQQKLDMLAQEKELPLKILLKNIKKSERDFYAALQKKDPAFIFECKHYSPSEGMLRKTYPVIELSQKYSQFADAISVLTNKRFFKGSFEHLKDISKKINKPVLCKDIIVNPYQVTLARYYGADAVLLMLSVLDDKEYITCRNKALALNMQVLTEVFSEEELTRAISLKASIICINHRNLHTMQIDMERVKKLAPHCPKDTFIIAASGIKTHQQVTALQPYANGFLIGSSLSKSDDLDILMRELTFGSIKICGLTRKQDIELAFQKGASYGGLIFAENSPRKVTLNEAKMLITVAPLRYVGVFVQQSINYVSKVAKTLNLYAVQLHGKESADYVNQLRHSLPPTCHIWKAYSHTQAFPTSLPQGIDKIVIDKAIMTGGTGESFDWGKLKNISLSDHIILAGGLSPENIKIAKKIGLGGLDINSGIESSPGIKDSIKLEKLFCKLREKEDHYAR